jgi:(E)-4-hydroxy-3-methylbut-2-enyl-diphosphate synthase
MKRRRKTREIRIGSKTIGGKHPILVQSMTNTATGKLEQTLRQIRALEKAGCEIVRVAVPDKDSCERISVLKEKARIPIVADIHYDYRLAIEAIRQGADKIRINPGNIGKKSRIKRIVKVAKDHGIPIRIGVNAGSLEKELWRKYGGPIPEAIVESVFRNTEMVESFGFTDIVLSAKSSSVPDTIVANRIIARETAYPLHLGITESGRASYGTIRSACGLAVLLFEGIGDTIRVSLTGNPVEEVTVGFRILQSLELREYGPVIVSCPTCGRMKIDIEPIVKKVEKRASKIKQNIKIAIMGCVVNGPGEARIADVGIACGKGEGVLFKRGKIVKNVAEEDLFQELMCEIDSVVEQMRKKDGKIP